ncbi:hypothetical protein BJP62_12330 [Jeongeupia sp. USM3]|nr:hypothetical protein BJP62_12330 [Jeongeupia sp. USM3]
MLLLGGCATSRSVVTVPAAPASAAATPNGKTVYINAVNDKRVFEATPKAPNVPSLDPSEAMGDDIKARAVARKRNSYGKALGDVLLAPGQTATLLVRQTLEKALIESGYTLVGDKDKVTRDTYIVDVNVDKLWAWFNPGFLAITLSAEVATDIEITRPGDARLEVISIKADDDYQTAADGNWVEIIQKALADYGKATKQKLGS